jgi:predicted membrane protein
MLAIYKKTFKVYNYSVKNKKLYREQEEVTDIMQVKINKDKIIINNHYNFFAFCFENKDIFKKIGDDINGK